MSDQKLATIAINTVPYLTPAMFHNLLTAFETPARIVKENENLLRKVDGVTPKIASAISALDVDKVAMAEFDMADKLEAAIVTYDEVAYPDRLLNIYAPPPVLSMQGALIEEDEIALAVIGARAATVYGKSVTKKIVGELVEAGVTIISGLARGIDKEAHKAAIAAGGRTIAVLGNGLNIYYPPENRELQKSISRDGAVISQFPLSASPDKTYFPLRNRVVAGLAYGALVVEAGEKSGALITAYAALDEGREVFAIPGPVNSKKSDGANLLIQKGHAKLVRSGAEIIDDLPYYVREQISENVSEHKTKVDPSLTFEEGLMLAAIDHIPAHIDKVADKAGLPSNKVSAILLSLELKGIISQAPGKLFMRN